MSSQSLNETHREKAVMTHKKLTRANTHKKKIGWPRRGEFRLGGGGGGGGGVGGEAAAKTKK